MLSHLRNRFHPQSHTNIEKATSFYQALCRVMQPQYFFLLVEHLHSCTSAHHYAYLSPHGGRLEPIYLLTMRLDVDDNGGGWLHHQASKFNSRRSPTLGHFVIEHHAVTALHWPMRQL